MREQVKLVFQIGYDLGQCGKRRSKYFQQYIFGRASRLCGGCTVSEKVGYWREDGDEHKAEFTGPLHEELCFDVELTCEVHKFAHVLEAMQDAIAFAADTNGIQTDWVHVSQTTIIGRHFSVKERMARMMEVA